MPVKPTMSTNSTATFCVRTYEVRRQKLERFAQTVETPFGPIAVKVGQWRVLTRGEVGELLGATAPVAHPKSAASARRRSASSGTKRRPWSARPPGSGDERRPRSRIPQRGGRGGQREKHR